MLDRLTDPARARAACEQNVARWHERLSTITVRTPEPSFDAMINRWLLYQSLGCRMWARSALYQSSGAYGFRDQLQDVMALVYAEPERRPRAHPPRGRPPVRRGRRPALVASARAAAACARFSDDMAWLPYVVDHYIRVTGDASVLDETAAFLTMRQLEPRRARGLRSAERLRPARLGLRALPASAAAGLHHRRARAAAHRHRRLERRHEPGGRRGPGRERVAGLVPHRHAPRVRRSRGAPGRRGRGRGLPAPRGRLRGRGRDRGLGRRVVPASLLRRRHAARLRDERRVPDRFDRAELERHLGARAIRSIARRPCGRSSGISCARTSASFRC